MKQITIDFEKLKGAVWGKQPEVATTLGIHPHTLSAKMNRKSRLHLDELNKIASAIGRDTTDFLKIVEVSPSTQEWFWAEEWQKGEREADEAIANGEIVGPFDNIGDALQALKTAEL